MITSFLSINLPITVSHPYSESWPRHINILLKKKRDSRFEEENHSSFNALVLIHYPSTSSTIGQTDKHTAHLRSTAKRQCFAHASPQATGEGSWTAGETTHRSRRGIPNQERSDPPRRRTPKKCSLLAINTIPLHRDVDVAVKAALPEVSILAASTLHHPCRRVVHPSPLDGHSYRCRLERATGLP